MAQNRQVEIDAAHSSSDEEEEEGSSEEQQASQSSSSEEDKTSPPTPPVTKKPSSSKKPETNRTPAVPGSSSSGESGSESDSDADSDSDSPPGKTRKADPSIKPIASKPMEDPSKATKKPKSKPKVPNSPPPAKSGAKRPVESEAKDSSRAKRIAIADDEANGAKKQLFQRLWSEDDEIVILKGMMDYRAKKGADPVADMNAFHDFIKKSLHVDVSKNQLSDKVRRLKKKFVNNSGKEKKGKDRTFSKPHEQKAYELSKKVWGREGNSVAVDSSSTKVNVTEKKNQIQNQRAIKAATSPKVERILSPLVQKKEVANVQKEVPRMEVENNVALSQSVQLSTSTADAPLGVERIIRDRLVLIEGSKKMELDEKWKQLHLEEVELYLRRAELIREQTNLVLEALKSAED